MHIVLLILKIIGIILLVLLGLILALLFLLVFVPFYYKAEGDFYDNKPYAKFRIRYLFPFLQIYVQYKDGVPDGKVKLLGITVYDVFSEKETSKEEECEILGNPKDAESYSTESKIQNPDATIVMENVSVDETKHKDMEDAEKDTEDTEDTPLGIWGKIKYFVCVIKNKCSELLTKLKEIKEKGLNFKAKISHVTTQIKYYYAICQMEVTKVVYEKAKHALLKLWNHLKPRKGYARFHFGTGDPASTGQICGIFGMLYPFLGKYIIPEPDFEQKIYEGDFCFSGHLTVFALLQVVWLILFDKDIRRLRKILINENKEDKHE